MTRKESESMTTPLPNVFCLHSKHVAKSSLQHNFATNNQMSSAEEGCYLGSRSAYEGQEKFQKGQYRL